jgi:Rps23 Pro-64 3,4-dihydroxylase Tpa1-like proline 4-hydroxylase
VINTITGETVRFDKPGVYACEPDGADYVTAPDMLLYMTILLQTLPPALNAHHHSTTMSSDSGTGTQWKLDNSAFNAKLAVTSSGGSKYPRHVDNVSGIHVGSNDLRKLTAILYLNPNWTSGHGGELRIYLPESDEKHENEDNKENNAELESSSSFVDLSPVGGRLVLFYSDTVPHEVLENAPHATVDDEKFDRYALTIWIPASPVE